MLNTTYHAMQLRSTARTSIATEQQISQKDASLFSHTSTIGDNEYRIQTTIKSTGKGRGVQGLSR